jgi:hypothetical protein
MFWWNQQIYMAKNPAARLIQYKIAQVIIFGNEGALFPQGIPRWRRHPTHNDITDFAFGMAGNNVNGFHGAHGI